MTLALVRLDDRYVHGQVVVGWGQALAVQRILLVDDAVRAAPWEQELYRLGVPSDVELEFASVAEADCRVRVLAAAPERVIVLVGDVATLVRVCSGAAAITQVNIGGLHSAPGRRERLPYVFLTPDEAESLARLGRGGIEVTAQDVPSARRVPVAEFA